MHERVADASTFEMPPRECAIAQDMIVDANNAMIYARRASTTMRAALLMLLYARGVLCPEARRMMHHADMFGARCAFKMRRARNAQDDAADYANVHD